MYSSECRCPGDVDDRVGTWKRMDGWMDGVDHVGFKGSRCPGPLSLLPPLQVPACPSAFPVPASAGCGCRPPVDLGNINHLIHRCVTRPQPHHLHHYRLLIYLPTYQNTHTPSYTYISPPPPPPPQLNHSRVFTLVFTLQISPTGYVLSEMSTASPTLI